MEIWAIVPVKSLKNSKRRLAHLLSKEEREALIKRLLGQVLGTLIALPAIENILVVSADPDVWQICRHYQVQVVKEPASQGMNIAIRRGIKAASDQGAKSALILPVDLPYISGTAVQSFLEGAAGRLVDKNGHVHDNGSGSSLQKKGLMAICPDENDQGTNALFFKPISEFSFHYGPGSFQKHLKEGEKRGLFVRIIPVPALQFDLDSEDDWYIYQSSVVLDC